ncbi:hypothetical protein WN944_024186 [Citrus x changshan-huyou]|uniref:Ubiquitin-like protease family profile domain-containing protein n=1 Tax=Citrus x changshan-huyou TaxID=2935761 RepID=A0AAP0LNF1_9ROSI
MRGTLLHQIWCERLAVAPNLVRQQALSHQSLCDRRAPVAPIFGSTCLPVAPVLVRPACPYMAKSESPDIEVGKMYFRYADHFPGRISSMCMLSSVVKAIEEKLTNRQLRMFKKDIFGHFLECRSFPFSGVILHNLLLRQVAHEEDSHEDQLWFQIGKHVIRLSIVEWCLVTRLSFGVDTNKKNDEMEQRLWNTYFGGVHRKINVKQFDAVFKELKFEEMNDMDALKIALFYFADRVLNVRKNHCQINFDWLDQVDDIQYFRKRPWGLLSWEMIYESLDNALFEKDEKFKKTRLKNPDHNIKKYNLYGFTSGVQAWIYEAIRGLPSTWVVKAKNKIPRILQWKPMASSRINFAEVYSFFNDESRLGDVLQTLEPNSKESSKNYWLSVNDYLPSIPDWVHKHQPSINAMPSVTRQSDEHDDHDDIPNNFGDIFDGMHIHEYLRLISEKQRQYPNALLQRVTHTDTLFWVFLNQLWNNGNCAVDSMVFDDRLNSYICGRQHTMSKSMTDVDMLLIPVNLDGAHWVLARVDFRKNKVWIYDSLLTNRDDKRYKLKFKPLEVIFPRWLEYVGFYNIRPELQSEDPWKVIAVKSAPQQEPGTGDCGVFVLMVTMYLMFGLRLEFNASHVEYFRKKIAVDIFNDDIQL